MGESDHSLSRLVAASSDWEHEPIAVPREVSILAWSGLAAAAISLLWLVIGNRLIDPWELEGWPVGGDIVAWALLTDVLPIAVSVCAASLVIGLVLAGLTHGFSEAGPRVQGGITVAGVAGTATAVPPAVAFAAAVVTAAIIVAAVVFLAAAVIYLLFAIVADL